MNEVQDKENNPAQAPKAPSVPNPTRGFYSGAGGKNSDKKAKAKGFLKKSGPIGGILGAVLACCLLMSGSQSGQAFSLVNNIMSNYDSSSYSSSVRLQNTIGKSISKKLKISDKLKTLLNKVGISVDTDADGTVKSYTDTSTGRTFSSDAEVQAGMKGSLGDSVAKAGQNASVEVINNSKVTTTAADRIDFNGNSQEGKTIEEFDEVARGTEKETTAQNYKESESEDSDGTKTDSGDSDGTKTKPALDEVESGSGKINKNDTQASSTKLKETALGAASKIASAASAAACIVSGAATAIAGLVIGQQMSDMINMSGGYMEATQKVQVTEGEQREQASAFFNEYQNRTNQGGQDGSNFWTSTSVVSIFGGDVGDSSAGIANLENSVTQSPELVALSSKEAWSVCLAARVASSAISLVASFFSFGFASVVDTVVSIAISTAIPLVVDAIVQAAVEALAVDVITDMGSAAAGDYTVGGGNIILSSMARSLGQSAGTAEAVVAFEKVKNDVIAQRAQYDRDHLSPFDTSSEYTFLGSLKQSLIAFSVLNSNDGALGLLTSTGSILSSSISALMPNSSAVVYSSIVKKDGACPLLNSVDGTGTNLHCYYNSISDVNSFGITYDEAKDFLCTKHDTDKHASPNLTNCEEGQTPTPTPDSELARYIQFWTIRDTHLGLADSSVTNAISIATANTGNSTADAAINGAISTVPVAGDMIDLVNAALEADNYEYVYGEQYVAGGESWNNDAEEMRNIQAFLELDTMYEELALIEESTLANFLEDYYAANPLDNSYEGKLARFSGLDKETVVAILDYFDYLDYIANYDPSDRIVFGEPETIESKISLAPTNHDSESHSMYFAYATTDSWWRENHRVTRQQQLA